MPRRQLRLWGLLLAAIFCQAGCSPASSPEAAHHELRLPSGTSPTASDGDMGLLAVAGDRHLPRIHQEHIFFGNINGRGDAVGFHYRPTGEHSGRARIVAGTQTPADRHGVYQAHVELRDPQTGQWVPKHAASTFYPDAWTPEQVLSEIRSAFGRRRNPQQRSDHFEGVSNSGVRIFGYLATDGSIVTAFPQQDRR